MKSPPSGMPAELVGRIQLRLPRQGSRTRYTTLDTAGLSLSGRIGFDPDTIIFAPRMRWFLLLLLSAAFLLVLATLAALVSSELRSSPWEAIGQFSGQLTTPEAGLPLLCGLILNLFLLGAAWWQARKMHRRFPLSQIVNVRASGRWVSFAILPSPEPDREDTRGRQASRTLAGQEEPSVFVNFWAKTDAEALLLKQELPEACAPSFDPAEEGTELAPDLQRASAQFHLGLLYQQRGQPVEAERAFRRAAEQGYARAQVDLGFLYDSGTAVTRDATEAVKWWRLAAEQGEVAAQLNLARMYGAGDGVTQDPTEAYKWLILAEAAGDMQDRKVAQNQKKDLGPMSSEQLAEARKRADEFVAQPKDQVAYESVEFKRKLTLATPCTWATWVLVGLGVLGFAIVQLSGVPAEDFGLKRGLYGHLAISDQWWRLFAGCFLHMKTLSLFLTLLALVSSRRIERLFGSPFYLAIYLASSLTAGLAVLGWQPPSSSVGPFLPLSSVLGVWGALLGYLVRWHKTIPRGYMITVLKFAGWLILYGAVSLLDDSSAKYKALTESGLLAGFLSGALYGVVAARPLEANRRKLITTRAALGLACSILLVDSLLVQKVLALGTVSP